MSGWKRARVGPEGAAASTIQRAWRRFKGKQALSNLVALRQARSDLEAGAMPGYKRQTVVVARAGELKGMDTNLDTAIGTIIDTTNTNAGIAVLNLVQPGTGSWNRVGRKIVPSSVRCYGTLTTEFNASATLGNWVGNWIRLIVVWDQQPSGTLPTFADIFGGTVQDGTESSSVMDPLRYDNMDRFKVLRDVRLTIDPSIAPLASGTANDLRLQTNFDFMVPLKGVETVYSGQSAPQTIADISTGALYFIARSMHDLANNCTTQIADGRARLRYRDP